MTDLPNLPPITDHEFWKELRVRLLDYSKPMPAIAAELGCDCRDLCKWVELYQPPKRETRSGVLAAQISAHAPIASKGEKFQAWRKARDGASKTLAGAK